MAEKTLDPWKKCIRQILPPSPHLHTQMRTLLRSFVHNLMAPFRSLTSQKPFSTVAGKEPEWAANCRGTGDQMDWDVGASSWFAGLTEEHFDGEVIGRRMPSGPATSGSAQSRPGRSCSDARWTDEEMAKVRELQAANRSGKPFIDSWDDKMNEVTVFMKQVREPGARGSYLKDSEKAEMYRKHKENPEVYTVERLAKEYRVMRQRVHSILWLKELEEEEEKKLGCPLDDSVELLIDTCPEFFVSHDREFHVASLPYQPDFNVMPEGWDGTTHDPDELHYEISMKEDEMMYQEFVQRMNFNKMMMAKQVKCHKLRRNRPSKRGTRCGFKFISHPNGSSQPANEVERMSSQRRRRILL